MIQRDWFSRHAGTSRQGISERPRRRNVKAVRRGRGADEPSAVQGGLQNRIRDISLRVRDPSPATIQTSAGSLWFPYGSTVRFDAALIAEGWEPADTDRIGEEDGRFVVHRGVPRLLRRDGRTARALRSADAAGIGRQAMTWIYVLGGIVALGLLVYLLCALLKPEWFQ